MDIPADDRRGARQTASLARRIYSLLKLMIENGRLSNGERILEAQVAKAFDVSRSPARGALKMLREEGFLREVEGNGYAVVSAQETARSGELAVLNAIPLHTPRQWERMYKEVEREIAIRILFGSVRVVEQKLADHFGVSRSVTREVLARMDGVGLLVKNRAGHWIANQATPERVGYLFELRKILEPRALIGAHPHIPRWRFDEAQNNLWGALSSSPVESENFDQVEQDLHTTLLSYCPNTEILHALSRTRSLFVPTRYLTDPFLGIPTSLIEAAIKEHLEIIEDCLRGDVDRAAARLEDHLSVAHTRWLERFKLNSNTARLSLPPYLSDC